MSHINLLQPLDAFKVTLLSQKTATDLWALASTDHSWSRSFDTPSARESLSDANRRGPWQAALGSVHAEDGIYIY